MTDDFDPRDLNSYNHKGTFSFNEYADGFDEHISKSIRGYTDLRDDVVGISKYFVEENTQVLDIGCSEGTLIERIAEENDFNNPVNFIGCEVNPAFIDGWSDPKREFWSFCSAPTKTQKNSEGKSVNVIDPDAPQSMHDTWKKFVGLCRN